MKKKVRISIAAMKLIVQLIVVIVMIVVLTAPRARAQGKTNNVVLIS